MIRRKTTEEDLKECKDKNFDPPVEDYVNAITKINHICFKVHIYPQTPQNHLLGDGCSICRG